jgi:hypothetical protein
MGITNGYMNIPVYKDDMIWYYEESWWYTNGDLEYIYIDYGDYYIYIDYGDYQWIYIMIIMTILDLIWFNII